MIYGVIKLVFAAGLLFGIYDYVTNKADAARSAGFAAGTVYALSDALGKKIEGFGTGEAYAWARWGVRWGLAIPGGLAAGVGAGIGNFGSEVVDSIYGAFTSSNGDTKTRQARLR